MAQMKAYIVPMKNLTLFCGKEYPCRKVFKKWMCTISIPGPHVGRGQNTNPEYQLKPLVSASQVVTSQLKEPRMRLVQGV